MLIYVGNGFIPGIPARLLSDDEVKKYGGEKFLLSTGLYEKPKDLEELEEMEIEEGE